MLCLRSPTRTRNLDRLYQAIGAISATMIGLTPTSDVVSRALGYPAFKARKLFGLPVPLLHFADLLFGHLPWDETREAIVALPAAIG